MRRQFHAVTHLEEIRMKTQISFLKMAAFVGMAMLVGACGSQMEPAKAAVASADSAIQSLSADAQKYVPDQFGEVVTSFANLKASFEKKDYKSVLASAPAL